MKRTIIAALLLGAGTGLATADVTLVYDASMAEKFEVKREIVDRVQAEFGEYAAYESDQELPPRLNTEIVPGEAMPANAPVEPVPAELGDLPTLAEGSHWVVSGNHLVEVTPDNRIVMVVYDALP